jgi:hypothetical protein
MRFGSSPDSKYQMVDSQKRLHILDLLELSHKDHFDSKRIVQGMCKQVFSFPTRFLQQSTANFHCKDFVSGKDFDNALQHMTVGKDNLGLFDTLAQLEKLNAHKG